MGPEVEKFYVIYQYMIKIRSFGDFIDWYMWLDTNYKIFYGIAIFGAIYLIYLFLKGALIDNEE